MMMISVNMEGVYCLKISTTLGVLLLGPFNPAQESLCVLKITHCDES